MPKSGKKGKGRKTAKSANTVETDPLVHTASLDPKVPSTKSRPKRLPRQSSATPSMPLRLGAETSAGHDPNPPGFASEVGRAFNDLPAAAGRAKRAPADDAWSGFDEGATGDAWGLSSGSLVEEPPSGNNARPQSQARRSTASGMDSDDAFLQAPLEHDLPKVKLVAVSGAEAGREFFMRDPEMGVGRGAENDVILADPSVSREHARITYTARQFALEDLSSGNGTFVNGKKIGRQPLRHGDEVLFGNVAFRFLEGDAAAANVGVVPPVARRSGLANLPHRGWRVAAGALGLLAVGAVLLGLFYLRRYGGWNGSEARRDMMFTHYERGVEAFKGRHWDQAEEQFTAASGLDPQNLRVRRYLKAVGRERTAEGQLAEAWQAHKHGDLARANALALGVLDASFRADAQALLRQIDADCEGRVSRGQQLLASGQAQEAMQMLQSVDAVRPGRPDVADMLVRANLKSGTNRVLPASLTNRSPRRRSPGVLGPLAEAHREFANGDLEPALQTLDPLNSEEAAALRNKVERFRDAYEGGMGEHQLKHPAAAIRMLSEAKTLEAQISGGGSKLLGDLDHKLADMYALQGAQSMAANALPPAYQSLSNAVNLVPGHPQASQKLEELARKAQQMFDDAGREADMQKSRTLLQEVVQIVPAQSELYRKAKQRLDALPP